MGALGVSVLLCELDSSSGQCCTGPIMEGLEHVNFISQSYWWCTYLEQIILKIPRLSFRLFFPEVRRSSAKPEETAPFLKTHTRGQNLFPTPGHFSALSGSGACAPPPASSPYPWEATAFLNQTLALPLKNAMNQTVSGWHGLGCSGSWVGTWWLGPLPRLGHCCHCSPPGCSGISLSLGKGMCLPWVACTQDP